MLYVQSDSDIMRDFIEGLNQDEKFYTETIKCLYVAYLWCYFYMFSLRANILYFDTIIVQFLMHWLLSACSLTGHALIHTCTL